MALPVRFPAAATALAALILPAGASARATVPHHGSSSSHRAVRTLPAAWVHRFHVRGVAADPDGDGLTNFTEYRAHTSPRRADTNHDGTADADADADRDGLTNLTEQRAGTDPGRRDSDRDRVPDRREDADRDGLPNLAEQQTANDPGDADSDDDGTKDGRENAGQVVGFDAASGVLRERLAASGAIVTGTVSDATLLECSTADDLEAGYDDGATGGDDEIVADEGEGDDAGDDPVGDDGAAGDGSADDGSNDDAGSDDVTAAAARLRVPDDAGADDAPADDTGADDACGAAAELTPGAWIHSAELDGQGFDGVELVTAAA